MTTTQARKMHAGEEKVEPYAFTDGIEETLLVPYMRSRPSRTVRKVPSMPQEEQQPQEAQ